MLSRRFFPLRRREIENLPPCAGVIKRRRGFPVRVTHYRQLKYRRRAVSIINVRYLDRTFG